jgi:aquaporin Z
MKGPAAMSNTPDNLEPAAEEIVIIDETTIIENPEQTEGEAHAAPDYSYAQRMGAEVWGTFVLVFGVIGAALFSAQTFQSNGAGFLGVAFALGFAVLVAAYTVGNVSGGHFNPAVSIGLALAKRFAWKDVPAYALAQIVGGLLAATVLYVIAGDGQEGFLDGLKQTGFASTGYGDASLGHFGLVAVIITEVISTAILVWVVLGSTSKGAPLGFAPLAIGLTLVVLNIVAVPISGASFNPARSIATAVYGGSTALSQLWVFIVAPIAGGAIAGLTFRPFFGRKGE